MVGVDWNAKKESHKELAFNQTILTKASRPRFLTSAAAPGRLAFGRCPIAMLSIYIDIDRDV